MPKKKGWRRWWLIIGLPLVVLGGIIAFEYIEAINPRYDIGYQRQRGDELRALRRQCGQIWDGKIEWERQRDLEAYCRRPLTTAEQEAYRKLLAFARDKKLDNTTRGFAVSELIKRPHISLADDLFAIAREVPPGWRWQEWDELHAAMAVFALSRIADKKVIPVLIESVGHPASGVRMNAIERLQQLLPLPAKFQWGKFSYENVKDKRQRRQAVAELQEWWKQNEKTAKVNWRGAGGVY